MESAATYMYIIVRYKDMCKIQRMLFKSIATLRKIERICKII